MPFQGSNHDWKFEAGPFKSMHKGCRNHYKLYLNWTCHSSGPYWGSDVFLIWELCGSSVLPLAPLRRRGVPYAVLSVLYLPLLVPGEEFLVWLREYLMDAIVSSSQIFEGDIRRLVVQMWFIPQIKLFHRSTQKLTGGMNIVSLGTHKITIFQLSHVQFLQKTVLKNRKTSYYAIFIIY